MKLLNFGRRRSARWASEFVEFVITTFLTDRPEEILFHCQPQRVDLKERIGGVWHSTLPLTPQSAHDAGTANFGDAVLDALTKMTSPTERSIAIGDKDQCVRLQIKIEGNTVRLLPQYQP